MVSQLQNTLLLFSLLFTGAGFVLGLFYNNRKVIRLEDKVLRLKRTIRHLQQKSEEPEPQQPNMLAGESIQAAR